jgi:anaerobic magnesium-protoporphyrin IX monomethyl ester cyclase
MRVVFLTLDAEEPLAYGIISLAGALRAHGHTVRMVQGRRIEALLKLPEVIGAEVLAMSATTGLHRVYNDWATRLRAAFPDALIVLGGAHPTFFPEVIEDAPYDGVCLGEGEESFPEFLDQAQPGEPRAVPGWWVRRDRGRGEVIRGPRRPPVADLDSLPFAAHDLFYDPARGGRPDYARAPHKVFLATRGCPFRCRYCFNRTLSEQRRPHGLILRTRDPERVCDEILDVKARWGLRLTWFLDANFIAHRPWLEAFLPVYRRRVGLPFVAKLRPDRATDPVVNLLADAGCTAVGVGIESGSERLRREVLGRGGSDQDIIEGCRRLRQKGIRLFSFNLLGIPSETLDEALRTVALNVACGVTFAAATILQPYPGTELARWAVEAGHFDGDFDRLGYSYFDPSPLRFARARDRDQVTNLQRLFSYAVEFPEVRRRLRWLIDRPPSQLFGHLFRLRHRRMMRTRIYHAFAPDPALPGRPFPSLEEAWASLGEG